MFNWIGSLTGIIGAMLLASNTSFSGYGYIFFIISSFCLTYSFIKCKMFSMVLQQATFLVINLTGGFLWLF